MRTIPTLKQVIQNELKHYPRGYEVFQCREYNDSYVIFIGQRDSNGKIWGGSSFPCIKKKDMSVEYVDIFDIPQAGYDEIAI